jgi:uncharacterized cupin superfamily protein
MTNPAPSQDRGSTLGARLYAFDSATMKYVGYWLCTQGGERNVADKWEFVALSEEQLAAGASP